MRKDKRILAKEAVAKLMATENIIVEHRQCSTAMFDIHNRKLILPIWKDMSDDLYSLMISHEVGHALYTHKDDFMSEIVEKKDYKLKTVFNIVEDARIEKLIQKKFPGTRSSFRNGYKELLDKDFFETNQKPIEEYKFLDRINLHYKLATHGALDVPFNIEEQEWIKKIDAAGTIKEVIDVSKQLLKYVEDQKEEVKETKEYVPAPGSGDSETENNQNGESIEVEPSSEGQDQKVKSVPGKKDQESLSETYDALEKNLQRLNDTNAEEPIYVNIPDADLNTIVTSFTDVHRQIKSHYQNHVSELKEAKDDLEKFKQKTRPIISHMVQIFEMKKKAAEYARATTQKTGLLDLDRMHTYKYNDDIFRKVTQIIGGKNHGLVMYIDMSASMTNNMQGTLEQLICLVLFCRKVNIPFEVYGFNDNNVDRFGSGHDLSVYQRAKENDILIPKGFELRQYFSSDMSSFQLNYAMIHMMAVANFYGYSGSSRFYNRPSQISSKRKTCPREEHLSNTPLNEAIICAIKMVSKFKERKKLDIVNAIFLTDGEATGHFSYQRDGRVGSIYNHGVIYVRSPVTKKTYPVLHHSSLYSGCAAVTRGLLGILRDICGIKVIGFYIDSSDDLSDNSIKSIVSTNVGGDDKPDFVKLARQYKTLGFLEAKNDGYDAYYIIRGGAELSTQEVDMVDDSIDDIQDIQKKFANMLQGRSSRKVVLTRFIEHIA